MNIILKTEWLTAIGQLNNEYQFIKGLLDYMHDADEVGCNAINGQEYEYFEIAGHRALFIAIKPEFDRLNFPPNNDINTAK